MKEASSPTTAPSISDEAVKGRTGRTWQEWFSILDKAGAKDMSHKEIVKLLSERYGVGDWWQQMVTVTYEQARGLREKHQTPIGYQASASRVMTVPLERVYKAWADDKLRLKWLEEKITVRKATTNKSMRILWSDATTSVDVNFYSKGQAKSQVSVGHTKLADRDEVEQKKAFWKSALDRLQNELEG